MKTPIQKLKSSKLFYNKWPYKVECRQPWASRIIHYGADKCKNWCLNGKGPLTSYYQSDKIDKVEFLQFIVAVEPFLSRKDDIQIRVEDNHFNLFCKDAIILEEIDNRVSEWISKISGPTSDEELKFLLSNDHRKILCDTFPKEKYKYRVYIKPAFAMNKRSSFVSWAANYGDKIEISETSKRWLLGERLYTQAPFLYVKDEKMLSMVGLYLSGNIKKTEEFILRENVLVA